MHQPVAPLGRRCQSSEGKVPERLVPLLVGKLRCIGQPRETPDSDGRGSEEDELSH